MKIGIGSPMTAPPRLQNLMRSMRGLAQPIVTVNIVNIRDFVASFGFARVRLS